MYTQAHIHKQRHTQANTQVRKIVYVQSDQVLLMLAMSVPVHHVTECY